MTTSTLPVAKPPTNQRIELTFESINGLKQTGAAMAVPNAIHPVIADGWMI